MSQPPWFIAAPNRWTPREVGLDEDESHHALNVLRISPPDVITVIDGEGIVARCAALRTEGRTLVAEVLEREERRRLKPEIVVYQGVAKGHKLDAALERLAELGIAEFSAFYSERAVARWDAGKMERQSDRWRAIARSAAKQSRNPYVLHAGGVLGWPELIRRVHREQLTVVLWEEASLPLRTALSDMAERVALVIGPEGGLTRSEAETLADAGGQLVSLGPWILRTENASVVGASALLYHFGLIG